MPRLRSTNNTLKGSLWSTHFCFCLESRPESCSVGSASKNCSGGLRPKGFIRRTKQPPLPAIAFASSSGGPRRPPASFLPWGYGPSVPPPFWRCRLRGCRAGGGGQGLWGDVSRGIPAVLAGIAVVLAFVGPGRYSVASSIGWKTYDQAVSSFQSGRPIDRSPADQGLANGNAAISQCAGPSLKGIGVRPDGSVLCTHGIDSAPAILSSSDTATVPRAPCSDSGALGPAVEVIYAVPQGTTSDYSNLVKTVRKKAAYADYYLDETNKRVDQHVRWLCNSAEGGRAQRADHPGLGQPHARFRGQLRSSARRRQRVHLQRHGLQSQEPGWSWSRLPQLRPARPHLFGLHGQDRGCLRSWVLRAGIALQRRQGDGRQPQQQGAFLFAHRVLGRRRGPTRARPQPRWGPAVRPHSSGGWHCYDLEDDMCYSDGGSYFTGGGSLLSVCPTSQDWHFDCGGDDYYNPAPPVGSYLATHWNVASSSFLTKPLSCPDSC